MGEIETIKRTLYYYYLYGEKKPAKKYQLPKDLRKNFLDSIQQILKKDKNDRKKDIKTKKKILYLEDVQYNEDDDIIFMEFISAKYSNIRRVVNTKTLEEQEEKKKNKEEGDEESICLGVKFDEEGQEAICLYEYNKDAIGFAIIINYLNQAILEVHKELDDGIGYKLITHQKVSTDFIKALEKTEKIKAVKITIDSQDLTASEIKELSGRADLSDDIDIVYKPSGVKIAKNTVKDFFKIYKSPKRKIKRVYVDSTYDSGIPLCFDTEKMREKEVIDVEVHVSGEVKKEDLFNQMKGFLLGS